jgi:hypothetical protein
MGNSGITANVGSKSQIPMHLYRANLLQFTWQISPKTKKGWPGITGQPNGLLTFKTIIQQ